MEVGYDGKKVYLLCLLCEYMEMPEQVLMSCHIITHQITSDRTCLSRIQDESISEGFDVFPVLRHLFASIFHFRIDLPEEMEIEEWLREGSLPRRQGCV